MTDEARYTSVTLTGGRGRLADDVRQGLTASRKWLPCKYFYDPEGNALFEQISELPEYYLTRTETAILAEHAASIIQRCPPDLALVELGSGGSTKIRYLIDSCLARQQALTYYAVDISPAGLQNGTRALVHAYPRLQVVGVAAEFGDGLSYLTTHAIGPRLIAFLGSTIGNFAEEDIARFFLMLRRHLRPIDRLLLGVDLIKDPAALEAAYDDTLGVTARFNLNILTRLNRELHADFDLTAFRHRVAWNREHNRIEMHLVSLRDQHVSIANLDLGIDFRQGETIHTENCYKYSRLGMESLLTRHEFHVLGHFTDPRDQFCLFLVS
ncbi:MAG: L-histidine N(alpha)-methyltransferase [candidate division NC10 bacterium]|nr:L-histidine N(alpha)-methyltransferase [candidate division NC10 bacterium]MDE2320704.1 L-histidine N(alpha)-methyltransferase [candidate division NC10 bacterium]